jgi:hypothetical protein
VTVTDLDTHRLTKQLRDIGLADAQVDTLVRLIAEAEAGRFDRQAAHDRLVWRCTPQQTAFLLGELLQRLARLGGSTR